MKIHIFFRLTPCFQGWMLLHTSEQSYPILTIMFLHDSNNSRFESLVFLRLQQVVAPSLGNEKLEILLTNILNNIPIIGTSELPLFIQNILIIIFKDQIHPLYMNHMLQSTRGAYLSLVCTCQTTNVPNLLWRRYHDQCQPMVCQKDYFIHNVPQNFQWLKYNQTFCVIRSKPFTRSIFFSFKYKPCSLQLP